MTSSIQAGQPQLAQHSVFMGWGSRLCLTCSEAQALSLSRTQLDKLAQQRLQATAMLLGEVALSYWVP